MAADPPRPAPGATRFLDPVVVSRLGTIELKARAIVEGYLLGLHRSPFRGFSVEFAEYRHYMPGDDPAFVDWKVYARSDRHYVKRFEQETNLPCHLLIDTSASMAYGSGEVTKLDYGRFLAAALAWLLARQRDAVGLLAFDDRIRAHLPPSTRPGHLRLLLTTLDHQEAGQRSSMARPLHDLAEMISRRGLVIVLSDLLDDPATVIAGLRHIRFRGMEVIVFHLLDHAELTFPFAGATRFKDPESDTEVLASPDAVREEYLRRLTSVTSEYERELRGCGIDYCLIDTSTPLDFALLKYLSARRRVA
jgi:uncharacterized protein (DUF58 family)